MRFSIMMRYTLAIGVAALSLLLALGGSAAAQSRSPLTNGKTDPGFPLVGQAPERQNYISPVFTPDTPEIKVYFSPRIYLTLGLGPNLFGLFENGVAKLDKMTNDMELYFEGTFFNLTSLDAMDIAPLHRDGCDKVMYFSVREDILLTNPNQNPFYVKKGDVAILDMNTWTFQPFFSAQDKNLWDVDACAVLDDGRLVFSPKGDYYYNVGPGVPVYFFDQDLGVYDPNTDIISLYLRGSDIGIHSLDAVDVKGDKVYFSVRTPEFVYLPGVFMQDGDIGCYDMNTGDLTLFLEGSPLFIYSIDALSVRIKNPGR